MLRRKEPESGEEPTSTDCAEDLQLLLDCLRYHHGNGRHGSPLRQALTTIGTMCSSDSMARDQVRKCGALSYLLELVLGQPAPVVMETALLALGCASEKNVVNQSKLCQLQLFSLLSSVLGSHDSHMTLCHSAAYLLSCLMTGNSRGQNMARESGALVSLISLFKSLLPSGEAGEGGEGVTCASGEGEEVWRSVANAICTATDNPQNEENQRVASGAFPAALAVLPLPPSHHKTLLHSTLSVITSCVANNSGVQSRFAMVGGLQCLMSALRRVAEGDGDRVCVQLLHCIYATASGHSANSQAVCSLGCVSLLLEQLRSPSLSASSLTSLILCLGCLVDGNPAVQRQVREEGGLALLMTYMTELQDDELAKAAVFVLKCCLQQTTGEEREREIPPGEAVPTSSREADNSQPHLTELKPRPSSSLSQSALSALDLKKPPHLKVKSWLTSSPPGHTSSVAITTSGNRNQLPWLQLLQRLLEEVDLSPLDQWKETLPAPRKTEGMESGNERSTDSTHLPPVADHTHLPRVADHTHLPPVADHTHLPPVADSAHLPPVGAMVTAGGLPHNTRYCPPSSEGDLRPHPPADHTHCLACRPRLKCPLVTSRTFLSILTSDPYTCPYHCRLATRLSSRSRGEGEAVVGRGSSVEGSPGSPTTSSDETYRPSSSGSTESLEHLSPSPPAPAIMSRVSLKPHSMLAAVLEQQLSPGPQPGSRHHPQTHTAHSHRYDLSHCPGRGRKRGGRVVALEPLRERGNILRGVGSEFDYSTPKTGQERRASEKIARPLVGVASSKVGVVTSTKVGVVPFSREEERQLLEGVRKFGRRWRHILSVYHFHQTRSSTSLKDKFRNLTERQPRKP